LASAYRPLGQGRNEYYDRTQLRCLSNAGRMSDEVLQEALQFEGTA